jgi:hypothetical protein
MLLAPVAKHPRYNCVPSSTSVPIPTLIMLYKPVCLLLNPFCENFSITLEAYGIKLTVL